MWYTIREEEDYEKRSYLVTLFLRQRVRWSHIGAGIKGVFESSDGGSKWSGLDGHSKEIMSDSNPLWKCYIVGYSIGDALRIGSIHATVNRIWLSTKIGPNFEVPFIEKNTLLFRRECLDERRVLQRKSWHVADVLFVVNE